MKPALSRIGFASASAGRTAVIIDQAELVYLRIADRAKQLRELGTSNRAIARALEVGDKTVAEASGPDLLATVVAIR